MRPLTDEQRRLVEEYAREYPEPIATLRSCWPQMWLMAQAAGLPDDDIHSAGWEGVVRAAQLFDPGRGVPFSSYASQWIRGYVGCACRESERWRARRTGHLVYGDQKGGNEPNAGSMWDVLGVSDPTNPAGDPDEFDRLDALKARVADVLRFLTPRYRRILELRFGMDGGPARTLEEVGVILGVTRERVRQLEAMALARVAVPLQVKCFDYVRFGRNAMNRESLNGTPAAGDALARLHVCPTCHKPYPGKRRRCFECKPAVGPGGRRQGAKARRVTSAAVAAPADLASAFRAAAAVEAAVSGLDRDTTRQIFDWITGRK